MPRIVALLVLSGLVGCAGTPVLPSVEAGLDAGDPGLRRAGTTRTTPRDPEPRWRIAPSENGAALELRF